MHFKKKRERLEFETKRVVLSSRPKIEERKRLEFETRNILFSVQDKKTGNSRVCDQKK